MEVELVSENMNVCLQECSSYCSNFSFNDSRWLNNDWRWRRIDPSFVNSRKLDDLNNDKILY